MDDNVSNAIAESLRRRGIDVTTTPSAGLMRFSDEEQIAFAIEQERVIFTQDTDFLRLNQDGVTHNGIVYCQKNSRSIGEIVRGLILIWEYVEPFDICRRVEFI